MNRSRITSLFIMVGDLSADKHTATLLAGLKKQIPDLKIWGVGGPAMQAEKMELICNCQEFSSLGPFEGFKYIFLFRKLRAQVLERIKNERPSLALLVDFGGFNLILADDLRKQEPQLPIYYFISPQVWASRPWRIKTIARTVDKMLCIFPFEQDLYTKRGITASFVGHPLTRNLRRENLKSKEDFCREWNLSCERPIIAVFPGSRKQEIRDNLPVALESIARLLVIRPDLQFVISQANDLFAESIQNLMKKYGLTEHLGKNIFIIKDIQNYAAIAASDFVWAKSGTTALEVTLLAKPMLIFYRGSWINYFLFRLFKTVPRVGWPNLLAGYDLVPELLQLDCRPQQIVKYTCDMLDAPALRHEISEKLKDLAKQLGAKDYVENCTNEILNVMSKPILAPSQY